MVQFVSLGDENFVMHRYSSLYWTDVRHDEVRVSAINSIELHYSEITPTVFSEKVNSKNFSAKKYSTYLVEFSIILLINTCSN